MQVIEKIAGIKIPKSRAFGGGFTMGKPTRFKRPRARLEPQLQAKLKSRAKSMGLFKPKDGRRVKSITMGGGGKPVVKYYSKAEMLRMGPIGKKPRK